MKRKGSDFFPDLPKAKNLGIWMDHAHAHFMEFATDTITTNIVSNPFTHRDKANSLGKSEEGMHHHFEHVRLETRESDKMTQNEQQAFVRKVRLRHSRTIDGD